MPCLVCGACPTVKSHIVPKALFHTMKRPGKAFIGGIGDQTGWKELQSGYWDERLLCEQHEARLGKADDYAVRFCRVFKQQADRGLTEAIVPNPHPQLLVEFACSVVWRMAASRGDLQPQRILGPYAERLARLIFDGEPYDPLLLISRHAFQIKRGETLNIGTLPYRYSELGVRFWRFVICGLIFDLKMDARGTPPAMATLAANAQTEITLFDDFPQDALRTPGLGPSLVAMSKPRLSFQRP